MALPNPPINPETPIPNLPFFYPETSFLYGPNGWTLLGNSLCVNSAGCINVVGGGGGGGGVTDLSAGPGIALSANTGNITVCTNLVAGSNIALTPSGNQISISAVGMGTGTVTLVSAGNGLSGGSITTSGSLSLNTNCVIQPSSFALKGNLLVGTAAGSYLALNPGTDGQVLVACGPANAAGLCWSSVGSVTSVTGTLPISVATGTTTPTISIASASTTASGAVQLNNTLSSTSTTLALTAAQGKVLQDQITSLLTTSGIELAGTIDASTGLVASVTSAGTGAGYTVSAVLPAAALATKNTYVIVTTPGTMTPPGGSPTVATRGDWFLASETAPSTYAWEFLNVGFDAPAASTTVAGIIELATNAETATGTDVTTAVTPASAAFAYIAKTALTAKGALVSATAASTPSALAVGTDGQVLVACAAATTGLCWVAPTPTGIPCACITAKGSLISGTAAATPTALPVGTDGNILVACALAPTGLCWTAPTPSGIPCSCILGKGALVTGTAGSTPVGLGVGIDGQLLVACAAATTGLCWFTLPTTLPATPTVAGVVLGCTNATNTALGCCALVSNTTGITNVAIGLCAAFANTSGSFNVYVGCGAGGRSTTGFYNVVVGQGALQGGVGATLTGSAVTAVGQGALRNVTGFGGDNTVSIGTNAGCSVTTGISNTFVGRNAGQNVTTGNQNVALGVLATVASPTGSCQLAIGFASGANWLTGDSGRNIQPGAGIRDCAGNIGTAGQVLCSTGTAIQWATPSSGSSTYWSAITCNYYRANVNSYVEQWSASCGNAAGFSVANSALGGTNNMICVPTDGYTYRMEVMGSVFGIGGSSTDKGALTFVNGQGPNAGAQYTGSLAGYNSGYALLANSTGISMTGFISGSPNVCTVSLRNIASYGQPGVIIDTFANNLMWVFTRT